MEKWPWQMARPVFNKDMTAYTLGYTFFTLFWGPVLSNPDIFETFYFFYVNLSFLPLKNLNQ